MKNVLKTFGTQIRRIYAIAIIAIIGFSFAACGGGDGEETPPLSAFAGTWNASNGRSIFIRGDYFEYRVIADKPYEGNFSVSGSKITFNATGAGSGKYTLSENTLVLSNHTWDNTVNGTYTKVGDGGDNVFKAMTFTEFDVWNVPGHEGSPRWGYQYKDANNPFDLSGMYANNKAYIFTYSFKSDIDIDEIALKFQNEPDWKDISDWTAFLFDIKKNTRYSGSFFILPNSDAAGTQPAKNFLGFYVSNRDVSTPATVSFYQFSLEQVEIATLNSVTANGSDSATTTQLTLVLSKAITGLSADDITLSGVKDVTKGTLGGSGTTYTLPISGFTKGGTLTVALEKSGYVFKNWLKTATIYYKSGSSGGDGDGGTFNSLDDFKNWLNGKGNNSKNNPYNVKLNLPNLSGLLDFLKGSLGKFLDLDLSGSSLTGIGADAFKGLSNLTGITLPSGITSIGANAFDGCSNLTNITLPSGINSIGANAFKDCSSLTSVTFNGTIPSGSFDSNAFSGLGDLRDKYLSGGVGTYTRTSGGTTWTKQSGSGQNDPGDLAGTWTGKIGSYDATITVSSSGWTMTASGTSFYDSGYFVRNGNTATLYLSSGTNNGTATLINSTTIQVVLNSNTIFPGTYTLTKQGSSGGGGGISTPTGLTATAASASSISLSWNTVSGASGYYVYVSESQNGTYEKITIGSVTTNSTTVNGLYGSNKTWWFKISAYDSNGNESAQSSAVSATTLGGGGDVTWTTVGDSKFGTSDIHAIAYGESRFVAGANDGKMAYSSDGVTWTSVGDSKFGTTAIESIAYGNGRFVAVGAYGKMAYSDNGITWTSVGDSKFDVYINGITFGGNKFVAVGNSGQIAYSNSNGTSWTAVTNSTVNTSSFYDIAYSGSRFVAVATNGKMAYSDDGITWTAVGDSKFGSNSIYRIAYGGGKFIAVGVHEPAYSTDNGITWTTINLTGYADYQVGITYGNNKFIAWGNRKLATSSDGLTWTAAGDLGNYVRCVTWGSNKFVAVGSMGKIAYWDGN
jgi:hypothetical protein